MDIKLILIPLTTGIVIASVVAIVNIKIKFATSAAEATRDVKLIFLRIAAWTGQAYLAFSLYEQLTASEPLTRKSLIFILLSSFGLFHGYVLYLLSNLRDLIHDQFTAQVATIKVIEKLPCIDDTKKDENKNNQKGQQKHRGDTV